MRRREFITLLGGAAAASPVSWQPAARAQQPQRLRRVGALIAQAETTTIARAFVAAFEQGLARRGWTIGHDLTINYRFGILDDAAARAPIADLLRLETEVILAHAVAAVEAAREATRTLPIVFVGVSEPITRGYIASLARPGGNITGFTNIEPSIAGQARGIDQADRAAHDGASRSGWTKQILTESIRWALADTGAKPPGQRGTATFARRARCYGALVTA
jgi:putative ABC transport system substrate-binding protein